MADARFCRMCQRMLRGMQTVYCSVECAGLGIRKLEDDPSLSMDSRCSRAYIRAGVLNELPMAAQLFLAERAQARRPSYEEWKAQSVTRCRCPKPSAYQGLERTPELEDELADCEDYAFRRTPGYYATVALQ